MQKPKSVSFDPNATYLLVGCFGGLGRSLAIWMVERGARCLMFLSRTGATSQEASSIIRELHSIGAEPEVVQCNVTDSESLSGAISRIPKTRQLKGIVHAAMVAGVSTQISISCMIHSDYRAGLILRQLQLLPSSQRTSSESHWNNQPT
jgi:NAD(P)-dependent dehydrogenase (short-subunit alcohol dehydrogenase family)